MDNEAASAISVEQFRAELEVFSGPLDLLLHLIRKEEVDIFEVSVSYITDRYLAALKTMEFFDINVAAEFLVVAATLMEMKSRTLLPPAELADEDEEEEDPGSELVRRLLEYKEFKEAAGDLAERARDQGLKFPRAPVRPDMDGEPEEPASLLEDLAVWDLMAAFAEVLEQTELRRPTEIVHDDIPVSAYIDEVADVLRGEGGTAEFLDFFANERSRARVIGILLALLELFRRKAISVEQVGGDRTRLRITLREPAEDEDAAEGDI